MTKKPKSTLRPWRRGLQPTTFRRLTPEKLADLNRLLGVCPDSDTRGQIEELGIRFCHGSAQVSGAPGAAHQRDQLLEIASAVLGAAKRLRMADDPVVDRLMNAVGGANPGRLIDDYLSIAVALIKGARKARRDVPKKLSGSTALTQFCDLLARFYQSHSGEISRLDSHRSKRTRRGSKVEYLTDGARFVAETVRWFHPSVTDSQLHTALSTVVSVRKAHWESLGIDTLRIRRVKSTE